MEETTQQLVWSAIYIANHDFGIMGGWETIWRIVTVTISCIISYSQNHGSLGYRQLTLCPHRRAGEFYITDKPEI